MTDIRSFKHTVPGRKKDRTVVVPVSLWIIKTLRDVKSPMSTEAIADEVQIRKPTVRVWCVRMEALGLVKRTRKTPNGGGVADFWSWVS